MTDLPPVINVRSSADDFTPHVEAVFEGGVRLRYTLTDDDKVLEQTFRVSDNDSPYREKEVTGHPWGDRPDVNAYLTVSLDVYFNHDTVESLQHDWSTLYEAFTDSKSL